MKIAHPTLLVLILVVLTGSVSVGADWPQWRGIDRDGRSPEKDLLEEWPAGGP